MQTDIKAVFLNLSGFGEIEEVAYFRDGRDKPPVKMRIPIVIEADEDSTKTWNKQESYQIPSNEQVLMQKTYIMYAALEDFGQAPRRKRYMRVGGNDYQINTVAVEAGMLRISLRNLEE